MKNLSVMMPVKCDYAWQVEMTRCAINTLYATTSEEFQLVIAHRPTEALPGMGFVFTPGTEQEKSVVVTTPDEDGGSPNRDCNKGLDACDGDTTLYMGNDIFVRPGWWEALRACFALTDCGAATVMSADLKGKLVPPEPWANPIQEGIYGPFMAFGSDLRFDAERFPSSFGDTDLIMQLYAGGLRMYRNWGVTIEHLNRQTVNREANEVDFQEARQRFLSKWRQSPLLMFRLLYGGNIL